MLTRSTLSDVEKNAQRTLAESAQFLCAGRAGFPEILQIFRAIFAKKLRHLERFSTLDSRVILRKNVRRLGE